jgi:hypothetical protein
MALVAKSKHVAVGLALSLLLKIADERPGTAHKQDLCHTRNMHLIWEKAASGLGYRLARRLPGESLRVSEQVRTSFAVHTEICVYCALY